ncbi:MAG: M48 family metalloprotease [Bacillota bacterium]|nr:M48 family metalloprotease [Bacillota bacterium]
MFCPKCGVESPSGAVYCYRCGGRLPEAAAAAQAGGDKDAPAANPKAVPRDLEANQYAHPLDRRSLEGIARFGPVVAVTRAIIRHWDEPMVKGQLLGGTVKVGPGQFADIHELAQSCATILNMEVPDIFIRHDPTFNAMTLGVERPLIILHSSVVEAFGPEELTFIIGHEMGHIKSEHVLYLSAAYVLTLGARGLADRLFGLGALIVVPAVHALQAWMRKAELTADRAGLLCLQDLDLARRSLIKLALGGRQLFERLDVDEYLRQADQASRDEYGRVSEFFQTHPHIANRVRELKYFRESALYSEILGQAPPTSRGQLEAAAMMGLERGRELLARVGGTVTGFLSARSTLERALTEFRRVHERYPGTEAARQALYYHGLTLMNLRRGLEAAKTFQTFVLTHPLHQLAPDAHYGLAVVFERLLHDKQAAAEEYSRLRSEFPESPQSAQAAEALAKLGQPVTELGKQA